MTTLGNHQVPDLQDTDLRTLNERIRTTERYLSQLRRARDAKLAVELDQPATTNPIATMEVEISLVKIEPMSEVQISRFAQGFIDQYGTFCPSGSLDQESATFPPPPVEEFPESHWDEAFHGARL